MDTYFKDFALQNLSLDFAFLWLFLIPFIKYSIDIHIFIHVFIKYSADIHVENVLIYRWVSEFTRH